MDDFARKSIEVHNKYRQVHQVPDITWSASLAREAQLWADKLARSKTLQHATKEERNGAGENLAMFSGRYDVAAEEATGMWYSEVEKYNFDNPTFQRGTGHFTQVVWKDSTELGMARAKTPDGKSTYVVGRYNKAGNMMGDFDKNVFPSKGGQIPSSRSTQPEQKSRVVEGSGGNPDGTPTRTVVKETRTQTPQGVKTIKTTTTWTTSGKQQKEETDFDPSPQLKSINISDRNDKPKFGKISEPNAARKPSPVPAAGPFKDESLKLHNHYRRLHQVPDVTWSKDLTHDAQVWADNIARMNTLKHAPADARDKNGENIAYFGGRRDNYAKETVDMWYDEVKKYQFRSPGFKSGTGHFTQVVWKGTKEIGMAFAQSPDGQNTFVVARYRPAGNMMRDFEANVFPAKK